MTLETATTRRDPRPNQEVIDRRSQTDAELMSGLLSRDEEAWSEFFTRFDPLLRRAVHRTLRGALQSMLDSDAIDDVLGDLYVELLERDMHKLRVWALSAQQASLRTWLSMLVAQVAIEHYRRAALRLCLPTRTWPPRSEAERANRWLAVDQEAGEGEPEPGKEAEPKGAAKATSFNKRTRRLQAVEEKLKKFRATSKTS